ncbi:MAG TPA: DNA-formamidopyrimidine glycosylase family protein [Solirubrobacteraceae bacterium]|nr:DNA-formamidopyrimidine glycosylase family protein [Solirubrobacteraceae bacterium]
MPEGDMIAYAAKRMRPVLEGHVPDEIQTPHPRHALDRWPERLAGRAVTEIRTHGKHLFMQFDGDLTIHSHLRMTGRWGVYGPGTGTRPLRSPRRAWLVLERAGHQVVQFNGPVLELLTESRMRFDQRLRALGPDILAPEFDFGHFLARLRADDHTRGIGDALLDQRNVAGIGNLWKSESCWGAAIDPWRPVSAVSDAEAVAIIEAARPGMFLSAATGDQDAHLRVFRRRGRPCPRCGTRILARAGGFGRALSGLAKDGLASRHPAGEDNRTTFWCPGCQR